MRVSPTAKREALRAIFAGQQVLSPASVFDPLSAQMAHRVGYEAMQLAGSVAANVALGAPDLMLLSVSEFAALVRRITRYCPLPLIVDADHGYGNAMGAARCVEELEAAGVAGLTIEDTELPARHGSTGSFIKGSAGGFVLTAPEETRGKLLAAVAAKVDPATVVVARTSAYAVGGVGELTKRLVAYRETGVDAFHIIGQLQPDEFPAVSSAAAGLPIMVSGPQTVSREELAGFGVRLALTPHTPFLAAVQAAYDAMRAARLGGEKPKTVAQGDLKELLRVEGYLDVQSRLMAVEKPAEGMK